MILRTISDEGINALDLFGSEITSELIFQTEQIIKQNFGIDYPDEKFNLLWQMIRDDNWSSERLIATTKWFLKNKKWAAWTICDWYDYGVILYPYSWYLKQISSGVKHEQMICYNIDGHFLWKLKDNQCLPVEQYGVVS